MFTYLNLLQNIIDNGERKQNRTGVDTLSLFGQSLRFNMNDGFPIVTTKYIHMKSVIHELLWFISGNTNTKYLTDNGVRIWNNWADENGDLGPVYGSKWRNFNGVDQLANIIDTLMKNPDDRRMIVSSWDPYVLPDTSKSFSENVANGKQALPPCHYSFQFVHTNGKLNLIWNQRSVDCPIGLPFNIASYALLLHIVAQCTGLKANDLVFSGADCHIYENQIPMIKKQLERDTLELPELVLTKGLYDIDSFTYDDIVLVGYEHWGKLNMPVAI